MMDPFGREITNLRISVTQKCNLNCIYCHREGVFDCPSSTREEIKSELIKKIVRCAAELGIRKVKVTGGEPLLREDIAEIIGTISQTKGIEDVSITTNGTLLERFAQPLKARIQGFLMQYRHTACRRVSNNLNRESWPAD